MSHEFAFCRMKLSIGSSLIKFFTVGVPTNLIAYLMNIMQVRSIHRLPFGIVFYVLKIFSMNDHFRQVAFEIRVYFLYMIVKELDNKV
jgi:hypothetical protein